MRQPQRPARGAPGAQASAGARLRRPVQGEQVGLRAAGRAAAQACGLQQAAAQRRRQRVQHGERLRQVSARARRRIRGRRRQVRPDMRGGPCACSTPACCVRPASAGQAMRIGP